MGKLQLNKIKKGQKKSASCEDHAAPICRCFLKSPSQTKQEQHNPTVLSSNCEADVKELVVIGAGPHSLSLLLRLLEPDADLLTEKERHTRAEYIQRMRPLPVVRRRVRILAQRRGASLLSDKGKTSRSKGTSQQTKENRSVPPPPIDLNRLRKTVLVLDDTTPIVDKEDKYKGWLARWKQNFDAIQIPVLRSPMSAHADPYDHRSLEFFAETTGRGDELVTLPYLQRGNDFTGPYQVPSTPLFHDFHDVLAKAYGIDDMVQQSVQVENILPMEGKTEPYFEVHVKDIAEPSLGKESNKKDVTRSTIKTKRVVCAMGSMFQTGEAFWETALRRELGQDYPSARILHCHEIVPWLLSLDNEAAYRDEPVSLLIVGGGITSTHLTLLAARDPSWCRAVTMIQRSKTKERQFDLENKWMGPGRGKLLDQFWALDAISRSRFLKDARRGGSVPPELVQQLRNAVRSSSNKVHVKEEVQITNVTWTDNKFVVDLDDGSPSASFDMIWLATGADNDLHLYPAMAKMQEDLPVQVVGGFPVLHRDLSWKSPLDSHDAPAEEESWKKILRRRFFVMGSLASLELGPDALNLLGARQGAVRVAKALRKDMMVVSPNDFS